MQLLFKLNSTMCVKVNRPSDTKTLPKATETPQKTKQQTCRVVFNWSLLIRKIDTGDWFHLKKPQTGGTTRSDFSSISAQFILWLGISGACEARSVSRP
jgi:hypothetical protein